MKSEMNHNQKLVLVAIAFLLLMIYPIISIFNKPRLISGIPILYVFIFGAWFVLIFIIMFLMRQKKQTKNSD